MRLLIADNDGVARRQLSGMIRDIPDCMEVGQAKDGMEAIYKSYKLGIDALLIEVEIPRVNGIDAIRHINRMQNPPVTIVTTANANNALDAYSVHVFSYLLKPVREKKLRDALKRASLYRGGGRRPMKVLDQGEQYRICCTSGKNMELVGLSEISHMRADNKYTLVFHKNGRIVVSDNSLQFFMKEFRHWVMQVHRNTLINKSYVKGLRVNSEGRGFVCLEGVRDMLPVSRRNFPELRRYIRSYGKPGQSKLKQR